MKKCSRCEQVKPLNEFQKRSQNKDGYTGICKVCKREYDNAHYKANPERRSYIAKNSQIRIKAVQKWVGEYLSNNPCIDCGESDIVVLEFDHRGEKSANVGNLLKTGNLETVQSEIAKCDVRCANCHRRKTAKDFGSWRLQVSVVQW